MLALTLRPACWPGSVRTSLIMPTLSEVFELGPIFATISFCLDTLVRG